MIADTIRGMVVKLFFTSDRFSAGLLMTENGQAVKFSGKFPVAVDDRCKLTGQYKEHEVYGWQFVATHIETDLPMDREGLIRFLAESDNFLGIGQKRAEEIVAAGNGDFENVLLKHPDKFLCIKGVTLTIIENLRQEWLKRKDENAAITVLSSWGLTMHQINKVIARFGPSAVTVVKQNPYSLAEAIDGFGFKRSDEIALKAGMARDSRIRIRAGLMHIVKEQLKDGHTWIVERELVQTAETTLQLSQLDADEIINIHLDDLLHSKALTSFSYFGTGVIAVPLYYEMERMILSGLKSERVQVDSTVTFRGRKSTLNQGQQDAFLGTMQNSRYLISGPAGSGKTWILKQLVTEFQKQDLSVTLCAPTGKAARRLEEVCKMPASTIHRLLGYDGIRFNHHGGNKLEADVIVVDECFDYKQPILTEIGWQYIGTVVNTKKKVKVWSRNPETGNLELKPVVRWLKHEGPEKILKIEASRSNSKRSMRVIKCTPDHKILTPYGYRKASELKKGEEIIVKGQKFSKEQKSVLIGSMLGDGGMSDPDCRTSPQIVFTQGDDQKDYLRFKQKIFGNNAGKTQKGKSGYTDKPVWRIAINVLDETYQIAQERIISGKHPSGRKRWIPTNRFLNWIDEQALCIWYLDNGSLGKHRLINGDYSYSSTIHSERFSRDDNRRIAKFLERRFYLFPKITPDSRGYFNLRFNKEETNKLMKIITPFVPECMSYKIIEEGKYQIKKVKMPDTTIGRVKSIEEVIPTSRYVFDIEVADYHNYVAGNIVVSNCSMIDVSLFYHLMDAIDSENTKLILAGDHNQLPPVGPGNVLRDMLQQKLIPYTILTEVVRQAGALKRNSIKILEGYVEGLHRIDKSSLDWQLETHHTTQNGLIKRLLELYESVLPKDYPDLIRDIQILSPMKKHALGTDYLNRTMQYVLQRKIYHNEICSESLNQPQKLYHGDKVIQTRNDYQLGIMNGHMGIVITADYHCNKYIIEFDTIGEIELKQSHLKHISLAYALTVHKVQGSEFPCVISIIHSTHTHMLHRNLFYTSVSRAKSAVFILGDQLGITRAARNVQVDQRRTFLSIMNE